MYKFRSVKVNGAMTDGQSIWARVDFLFAYFANKYKESLSIMQLQKASFFSKLNYNCPKEMIRLAISPWSLLRIFSSVI